jgi:alpha-ketoglutarate-dependent taurine dioxygenase
MYVRNFIEGLDMSWQSFYGTDDRRVVEARCRESGTEFEWRGDNWLRTRRVCPAVARHPRTGETVFFNQVQLHHVSCLEQSVRETLLSMYREEELPRNVYYGDGSPIEDSVVVEIIETYRRAAVSFPWREGDILVLDNMLTAHARNPFTGPRKIVVAMGEMTDGDGETVMNMGAQTKRG